MRNNPKNETTLSTLESFDDIFNNSLSYLESNKPLLFFEKMNVYAAFKYNVVKDILENNNDITVSNVHIGLNDLYFGLNEVKHQLNKKASFSHLPFLSKKKVYDKNDFLSNTILHLTKHISKNKSVDLVEQLIAPCIFINALNEYGWLEVFSWLNPENENFDFEKAIASTKLYSEDIKHLQLFFKEHLESNGKVPEIMSSLIEKMQTDSEINNESKARFLSSLIFSAVESTISFVSSFVYVICTEYKHLLSQYHQNIPTLEKIAQEVLRIYTPVPYIFRTVRNNTIYGNTQLKIGDTVLLFLSSANLDKTVFENPYKIDVNRTGKHLSFGSGPYACIGRFASLNTGLNFISILHDLNINIYFEDKQLNHYLQFGILKCKLNARLV